MEIKETNFFFNFDILSFTETCIMMKLIIRKIYKTFSNLFVVTDRTGGGVAVDVNQSITATRRNG